MADTESKKIVVGFVDDEGVKAIISQHLGEIEDKAITKDDVDAGLTYGDDGKLKVNTITEADIDSSGASDDTYYTSSAVKKLIEDKMKDNSNDLVWS